MNGSDERISRIEECLAAIERALGLQTPGNQRQIPVTPLSSAEHVSPPPAPASPPTYPVSSPRMSTATSVLGWGGMAAFVLASAYLIRLAIDADWLTPKRQVGLAAMFGMVLTGTGFVLREKYSRYASLLPACGIVVLFLTNYGAHLYHRIIGPLPATVGVVVISLGALALGRVFKEEWYALFAVVGSYTGPRSVCHLKTAYTALGTVDRLRKHGVAVNSVCHSAECHAGGNSGWTFHRDGLCCCCPAACRIS